MGFDDLLIEIGHADLAEDILLNTNAAIAISSQFELPLSEAIVIQPERVMELYDHIDVITDQIEVDLATVLLMEVPAQTTGEGDSD